MWEDFVAQIGLRSCLSLPQTDLAYIDCSGKAKRREPVKDHRVDLDCYDLPIEVTRREPLTKQFNTRHFRLNAASAVISSQLPLQYTAQIFWGSNSFVSHPRTGLIRLPQLSVFTGWNDRMYNASHNSIVAFASIVCTVHSDAPDFLVRWDLTE